MSEGLPGVDKREEFTDAIELGSLEAALAEVRKAFAEGKLAGYALFALMDVPEIGPMVMSATSASHIKMEAAGAMLKLMEVVAHGSILPKAQEFAMAELARGLQAAADAQAAAAPASDSGTPPETPPLH